MRISTLGFILVAATGLPANAATTAFNRDIRPIFAKHCTACHGGVKAAGNISFVYRDKAIAKGKSGELAIVPGRPEQSELIKRVTSTDPDEVMPKPEHGPRLSPSEIELLTTWIAEGAVWSEHWSFVPPRDVAAPEVKDKAWPRSVADRWVLARLEAENLKPAPAASLAEWLRRVSLDLVGLPPTAAEFEAFRKDAVSDPDGAKKRVVDRLLKSPQFGERWASMWLDLARYSDTYGFEKDPHRDIWPWRDWVIRAFNADMPFDQFTIKQLAGDLLPNPTTDDLLATAFHRNTQNNTEGGTDDEEYRTAAVLDRVNTTWTAWQATTFGCVQCHSHPYDPFPHDDYYRYAAFFNSTEDCDLNDDFPRLPMPEDAAQRMRVSELEREVRSSREALNSAGLSLKAKDKWRVLFPTSVESSGGKLTLGTDGKVDAEGTLPVGVVYTMRLPMESGMTALRLEILPDQADPKKWPERGSVLSHLEAAVIRPDGRRETVKLREVFVDELAGPFDPQESLVADAGGFGGFPVLEGPRWCVVVPETPLAELPRGSLLELKMTQSAASNSGFQGCPIRHFTLAASTDAAWTKLVADPERQALWRRHLAAKSELGRLPGPRVPVLMQRDARARRDTRVFIRGNRTDRDASVEAGIPDVVNPPRGKAKLNRLDLARWMVSDQNPLTARVLANRLWAEMFGRGIVETLEDFGTTGARPTHPELLDHLALRLMHEQRWSVKAFLREIALSAAYGQTAVASREKIERDPSNALIARGPRTRLTAEMVRDQALAWSGLLSPKLFGPPLYPPQPEGVWSSVYSGASWKTSQGEDRYRRAIYTYSKRTSGYPAFLTFDAPTRDACMARRTATNTPLQALVTLNDPAFIELAQAMARNLRQGGGSVREQIARGCRMLTLEEPPPRMMDRLLQLHGSALKVYLADPGTSAKLGASPDEAALVLVASTLMNLDEALAR